MQLVLTDLELDPKKFPVRAVMSWVSTNKNELVDHETAATRAETEIEEATRRPTRTTSAASRPPTRSTSTTSS